MQPHQLCIPGNGQIPLDKMPPDRIPILKDIYIEGILSGGDFV